LYKGTHLLIDCHNVPSQLCLNDELLLDVLARSAKKAGATVISQIRYRFGADSPPGCTAVVMLDESHCSVHSYADAGMMAFDIFTCGSTDPRFVWSLISDELGIIDADIREVGRFIGSGQPASASAT